MTGTVDRWQLDESSAKAYEPYLVPLFFAPGAQYLIELAALKRGEEYLTWLAELVSWRTPPYSLHFSASQTNARCSCYHR
jgi:hypothetical protein